MLFVRPTAQQRRAYMDRRRHGELVTLQGDAYAGKEFWVYSVEVPGAKVGAIALPVGTFGVFIASAKPREFNFSPLDFAPYTTLPPPSEGNVLVRMGLLYLLTNSDRNNTGTNTQDVLLDGYCWIDKIAQPA